MHYLVDGYNYLHRARLFDGRSLEGSRRRLAERLRVLRRAGDQLSIVWDAQNAPPGLPSIEPQRSIDHVFAHRTGSADDDIVARVRNADDPARLCVISDDGDVARPARQLGARVLSIREAEALVARLGGGPRAPAPRSEVADEDEDDEVKPAPPSGAEADAWLRAFEEEDSGGHPGDRA